jgi:uncharacterized protein (DUF427 family)
MTDTTTSPPQVRTEACAKRVRAYLAGQLVADSSRTLLVWEHPRFPAYWFPEDDVVAALEPSSGDAGRLDVAVGPPERRTVAPAAARRAPQPGAEAGRQYVTIDWPAMTEWLEEDEPVYVHARSPYTRVDTLRSSRHVVVVVDGITVADSVRPTVLFETGLRPRWYLPLTDVDTTMLEPSDATTQCPYKGTATYWSVRTPVRLHRDLVWTYRAPLPEAIKVAGLLCFYDERAEVRVDP